MLTEIVNIYQNILNTISIRIIYKLIASEFDTTNNLETEIANNEELQRYLETKSKMSEKALGDSQTLFIYHESIYK